MSLVDEIFAKLQVLPPDQQMSVIASTEKAIGGKKWIPNPGPQTDAYYSKADVLLFGGEPGGGKALRLDTPLPTPFGWTTMGEVRIGDAVLDERGVPCSVVAKSEIDASEQAYRLTFSDGSQIVAGARHQWVTRDRTERLRAWGCTDERRAKRRADRPGRGTGKRPDLAARNTAWAAPLNLPQSSIKTTAEIASSVQRAGRTNHCIDACGPLRLDAVELLIEPYVLGAWLGDGTSSSGAISGIDEEIFAEVSNGYTVTRCTNPTLRGVLGLQTQLRQLGLLNNKHIPPAYLRASIDQRLALLQGLMDTDGYCDKRGHCDIQLTRKELIDGVQELLHSLGIKNEMHEGEAKLYGRVVSKKWRLVFMTELQAFRLPRKLLRQKRSGFRGTHDVRYIVACDPVESVPMQCIQVDSPSRCYLAGRAMIPTHNSQLVLGLAFNEHQRSLVMRRQYGDLDRLVEDALKIHGSREGFNGSPPPKLRISERHIIDFAAAHRVGDEQSQMGKGKDGLFIDEATHFAESQVRFLMGWVRTEDPNQRTRVVFATNPPLESEGMWVIDMFAPWLNPQFPNPAKPGELRWVVSDSDGKDQWVEGPGQYPVTVAGKVEMVTAKSRTYIPSSVDDNPYYVASGYKAQLHAMGEPHRSLLMGGFKTAFKDKPDQVIPTKWVEMAQERWTTQPPPDVPMCNMGVDASGGGEDPMIIATRYDGWFAPYVRVEGKEIPIERSGAFCGGIVISHRRDKALVTIDMGGGYGGPMYEHLYDNGVEVRTYKGAEGTTRRGAEGKIKFRNKRSAALWLFREALDPGQPGGSPIALPPGRQIVADLTAPTFKPTPNGIEVESKEDVCDRLGRSTDEGDATIMCWFEGPRHTTDALDWIERKASLGGRRPQVVLGGRTPLSATRRT